MRIFTFQIPKKRWVTTTHPEDFIPLGHRSTRVFEDDAANLTQLPEKGTESMENWLKIDEALSHPDVQSIKGATLQFFGTK